MSTQATQSREAPLRPRRTNLRWTMVGITGLLGIVSGIDRANISILTKPLIEHHITTRATLGLANGLFMIAYAISNVAGGYAVDRFGAKRLMTWAAGWWGVLTTLTAAALSGAGFVLVRILLGLGEGLHGPTGGKWCKEWFPTRERAISMTIQSAGLWVGPLITGPFVTWLYLSTNSLRVPWLIMGIGTLVLTLPFIILVGRDRPEQHPRVSPLEVEYIRQGQLQEKKNEVAENNPFADYRYWLILVSWIGMAAVFFGVTFWFPLYMENVRHLSVRATGLWYAVPYAMMTVLAVIGSLTSDRIGRRAPFISIFLIVAGAFLFLATRMSSVTGALLLISLGLAVMGLVQPNITATIIQITRSSKLGLVYGVAIAAQNLGSAIGVYIIGLSFTVGFVYMESVAVLGGVAGLILALKGL